MYYNIIKRVEIENISRYRTLRNIEVFNDSCSKKRGKGVREGYGWLAQTNFL